MTEILTGSKETQLQPIARTTLLSLVAFACLIAGCVSTTSVTQTYYSPDHDDKSYSNFLVVAIIEDYTSRAQYERAVVSELRKKGAAGTPYYVAAGGNTVIDREAIRAVLSTGDYDAVLMTHVHAKEAKIEKLPDTARTNVTRRNKSPIDFFRYDYEEISEPGEISASKQATLATELYSARNETKLWSVEVSSSGAGGFGHLIDDLAAGVVQRLQRDRLIAK